ncbi:hypothetical protein [Streptomyces sp. NPDC051219]|uniref:hypothetical protein n=1 Tax=Streptomyces sp. NPDC051219 TaxID=3155283 RepID=UPI0034369797
MTTLRRAAYGRQLLLLAVLLLGIVTMHTLGHPTQGHSEGTAAHTVSAAPPEHHTAGRSAPPHTAPHTALHAAVESAAGRTAPGQTAAGRAGPELPGTDMDPMSVCLAVLGALTLFVLAAGPLRAGPVGALPSVPDQLLRALWPDPPPRKAVLARLSVLRI